MIYQIDKCHDASTIDNHVLSNVTRGIVLEYAVTFNKTIEYIYMIIWRIISIGQFAEESIQIKWNK